MAAILAVLEQREGAIKRVSHEVLTAARSLGDEMGMQVEALLVGPLQLNADGLGKFGADKVYLIEADDLKFYQPDLYSAAVVDRMDAGEYAAVVVAATSLGKDLGPRVAARLGCPLAADVTSIKHDGQIVVTRPVYSGKAVYTLRITQTPCVISVRPNVFTPVETAKDGVVEIVQIPAGVEIRARTLSVREPEEAKLDVAEASIIVSGGRGLKGPENFHLIEELASAIGGAAVGASRAVVDAGWRPHSEQVGQTGKTVSPNLYIAVGISGAIQHLAGMRTAKVIVAINKDKEAPIFKIADYGIVGDLFAIVPRLTEEIKKLRAN